MLGQSCPYMWVQFSPGASNHSCARTGFKPVSSRLQAYGENIRLGECGFKPGFMPVSSSGKYLRVDCVFSSVSSAVSGLGRHLSDRKQKRSLLAPRLLQTPGFKPLKALVSSPGTKQCGFRPLKPRLQATVSSRFQPGFKAYIRRGRFQT